MGHLHGLANPQRPSGLSHWPSSAVTRPLLARRGMPANGRMTRWPVNAHSLTHTTFTAQAKLPTPTEPMHSPSPLLATSRGTARFPASVSTLRRAEGGHGSRQRSAAEGGSSYPPSHPRPIRTQGTALLSHPRGRGSRGTSFFPYGSGSAGGNAHDLLRPARSPGSFLSARDPAPTCKPVAHAPEQHRACLADRGTGSALSAGDPTPSCKPVAHTPGQYRARITDRASHAGHGTGSAGSAPLPLRRHRHFRDCSSRP